MLRLSRLHTVATRLDWGRMRGGHGGQRQLLGVLGQGRGGSGPMGLWRRRMHSDAIRSVTHSATDLVAAVQEEERVDVLRQQLVEMVSNPSLATSTDLDACCAIVDSMLDSLSPVTTLPGDISLVIRASGILSKPLPISRVVTIASELSPAELHSATAAVVSNSIRHGVDHVDAAIAALVPVTNRFLSPNHLRQALADGVIGASPVDSSVLSCMHKSALGHRLLLSILKQSVLQPIAGVASAMATHTFLDEIYRIDGGGGSNSSSSNNTTTPITHTLLPRHAEHLRRSETGKDAFAPTPFDAVVSFPLASDAIAYSIATIECASTPHLKPFMSLYVGAIAGVRPSPVKSSPSLDDFCNTLGERYGRSPGRRGALERLLLAQGMGIAGYHTGFMRLCATWHQSGVISDVTPQMPLVDELVAFTSGCARRAAVTSGPKPILLTEKDNIVGEVDAAVDTVASLLARTHGTSVSAVRASLTSHVPFRAELARVNARMRCPDRVQQVLAGLSDETLAEYQLHSEMALALTTRGYYSSSVADMPRDISASTSPTTDLAHSLTLLQGANSFFHDVHAKGASESIDNFAEPVRPLIQQARERSRRSPLPDATAQRALPNWSHEFLDSVYTHSLKTSGLLESVPIEDFVEALTWMASRDLVSLVFDPHTLKAVRNRFHDNMSYAGIARDIEVMKQSHASIIAALATTVRQPSYRTLPRLRHRSALAQQLQRHDLVSGVFTLPIAQALVDIDRSDAAFEVLDATRVSGNSSMREHVLRHSLHSQLGEYIFRRHFRLLLRKRSLHKALSLLSHRVTNGRAVDAHLSELLLCMSSDRSSATGDSSTSPAVSVRALVAVLRATLSLTSVRHSVLLNEHFHTIHNLIALDHSVFERGECYPLYRAVFDAHRDCIFSLTDEHIESAIFHSRRPQDVLVSLSVALRTPTCVTPRVFVAALDALRDMCGSVEVPQVIDLLASRPLIDPICSYAALAAVYDIPVRRIVDDDETDRRGEAVDIEREEDDGATAADADDDGLEALSADYTVANVFPANMPVSGLRESMYQRFGTPLQLLEYLAVPFAHGDIILTPLLLAGTLLAPEASREDVRLIASSLPMLAASHPRWSLSKELASMLVRFAQRHADGHLLDATFPSLHNETLGLYLAASAELGHRHADRAVANVLKGRQMDHQHLLRVFVDAHSLMECEEYKIESLAVMTISVLERLPVELYNTAEFRSRFISNTAHRLMDADPWLAKVLNSTLREGYDSSFYSKMRSGQASSLSARWAALSENLTLTLRLYRELQNATRRKGHSDADHMKYHGLAVKDEAVARATLQGYQTQSPSESDAQPHSQSTPNSNDPL